MRVSRHKVTTKIFVSSCGAHSFSRPGKAAWLSMRKGKQTLPHPTLGHIKTSHSPRSNTTHEFRVMVSKKWQF